MYDMFNNKVVLITRIYRKTKSQVVAISQKRAWEYIKISKKSDLEGVEYTTEEVWLV